MGKPDLVFVASGASGELHNFVKLFLNILDNLIKINVFVTIYVGFCVEKNSANRLACRMGMQQTMGNCYFATLVDILHSCNKLAVKLCHMYYV